MSLDIRLLGPVEILVDGSPIDVDTRKATALLSYLALNSGPLPRGSAALLLWPDAPTESARGSLRRTLSALRKGLHGRWIEADRSEIALVHNTEIVVDALRFDELASADHPDALIEAADLYRGDFMAGFSLRDSADFDDWQMSQAGTYRRTASGLFERLSSRYEESSQMTEAIDAASHWLALDPLHEAAHRRLMVLHAASGDRNAAVRQFRECVRVFEEELGVPPLDETIELYQRIVEGDGVAASAVVPPRPQVPVTVPGFVGREADLAALDAAFDRSRQGIVNVVIVGEPGIGKTRLVEEFVGPHTGSVVVRVGGHPAERTLPYGITVEMIQAGMALPGSEQRLEQVPQRWLIETSRIVPEIDNFIGELPEAPPLAGPGGHRQMIEGLATVILGLIEGSDPGVIFIDDAHWSDPASVEVLALLANPRRAGRALVLLALRSDAVPDDHPLHDFRHASQTVPTVIELSRLREDEVGDLLTVDAPSLSDRTHDLYRVSEGVPYILVEYLAAMRRGDDDLGALPGGVRALLQERLDGLTGVALQVAGAAAVLQRSFVFDELQLLAGRTEGETLEAMEELLGSNVIVDVDGDVLRFTHESMQQYVYESMNGVRRKLLHGRAADALMAPSSSSLDAAVIAEHFAQAGRPEEAAAQHLVAADAAAALHANDDALGHYEAALALGHPEVFRIRESMAELHALGGNYGPALIGFEAAAAGAEGGDQGRIEAKIANVHARLGHWDLAEGHFAAAIEALEDDPVERSRALAARASTKHRAGDGVRAGELAVEALDDATLADDRHALAEAHNVLGIVQRSSDPDGARHHHEVALALSDERNPVIKAAALNNLALTYLSAGEPEEGLGPAQEALRLCVRVGDRHKIAAVHNNLADLYHAAGRDDEAIDHLKAAAVIFSEIGVGGEELQPEIWMLSDW